MKLRQKAQKWNIKAHRSWDPTQSQFNKLSHSVTSFGHISLIQEPSRKSNAWNVKKVAKISYSDYPATNIKTGLFIKFFINCCSKQPYSQAFGLKFVPVIYLSKMFQTFGKIVFPESGTTLFQLRTLCFPVVWHEWRSFSSRALLTFQLQRMYRLNEVLPRCPGQLPQRHL